MDAGLEIRRQIQRNELRQANNFANSSLYRIGDKAETGLYQVLGMQGEVVGYGQIIFKLPYNYGDIVRATKPYGSNIWTLDRPDTDTDDPNDPDQNNNDPLPPPPPPPPPPPNLPPNNNGAPTIPPNLPPNGGGGGQTPPKPRRSPVNCQPPPKGCEWVPRSAGCNAQIQDYDYVELNTGDLILCCDPSVTPPPNGGCSPVRFACRNGTCYPSASGGYATASACQAALIPPPFTGGQCPDGVYSVTVYYEQYNLSFGAPILIRSGFGTVTVIGKVTGVSSYQEIFPNGTTSAAGIRVAGSVDDREIGVIGIGGIFRVDIIDIVITGSPNNCGDPPARCP